MHYTVTMHDRKQDWKTFTKLKEVAIERFFEQANEKFEIISQDSSLSARERYHTLCQTVKREDKERVTLFERLNPSLSNADLYLQIIVNAGLLTEEELSEFSDETLALLHR